MIAAISGGRRSGVRRVDLNNDMGAIADLIELCFGPRMDAGGRSTINEMRALSRMGPLLPMVALVDEVVKGIGQGFVWEEDGQIVGNVTLTAARQPRELDRITTVANVAVHPDYQRRGIARQLMEISLETIRAAGETAAILQVEADNDPARLLYERLGFRLERTWHRWRRSSHSALPLRLTAGPRLTLRRGDWREDYALAERIFPPERGGLGWQRPLHPREFRRTPLQQVADFLAGTSLAHWSLYEESRLAGSLWARTRFGSALSRLTLLVHPEWQGRLEPYLLNVGVWQLASGYRSLYCEHPADDQAASDVFRRNEFHPHRTLHHMRLDL